MMPSRLRDKQQVSSPTIVSGCNPSLTIMLERQILLTERMGMHQTSHRSVNLGRIATA